MTLPIWRISQTENNGYDTYDSAIVVAATEDGARKVHPSEYGVGWSDDLGWYGVHDCATTKPELHGKRYQFGNGDWTTPDNVVAAHVGTADEQFGEGSVLCASFNAG